MASINISEDDFSAVAGAARDAAKRGDVTEAAALDKIARKINAALSNSGWARKMSRSMGGTGTALNWTDVPSTLAE